MKDAIRKIKKFKVVDHETGKPLVVVEAVDEDEAGLRTAIVSCFLRLPVDPAARALEVTVQRGPIYLPYFTEGYFAVLEAMNNTRN